MYIDTHIHLRDFNESYKETIRHGLEVARDSGLDAVLDMPNTNPAVTSTEVFQRRLLLAQQANVPEVFYGVFLGLTPEPEQVKRMIELANTHPQAVGLKLYTCHSVGDVSVPRKEDQQRIYALLKEEGFSKVLVLHAEHHDRLKPDRFDPAFPLSHAEARPEVAEPLSVIEHLHFAAQAGYRGKIHIAHVSSPATVGLITTARAKGEDVSVGITLHHLVYGAEQMAQDNGLLWKVNPPLRPEYRRPSLLQALRDGKIDWIESDHAPHTLSEKTSPPYLSGIPGLPWWPLVEQFLQAQGFSEKRIEQLTFSHAARRFGLNVERSQRLWKDHRHEYAFNPFRSLERELGWP